MRHDYYLITPFDPTTGIKCVCKERICAFKMLHSSFPLSRSATLLLLEKKIFDLRSPLGVKGVCKGRI